MTKPTGKVRGRPKKHPLAEKPFGARGRPRLNLMNDPDRYAIAALPAFMNRFKVNERVASILVVQFIGTKKRPETIRWKARKNWLEAGSSHLLFDSYLSKKTYGTSKRIFANSSLELQWLRSAAEAIFLALEGGGRTGRHQTEKLQKIIGLIQKEGDLDFVKSRLIGFLVKDDQVIDFMNENKMLLDLSYFR